MIAFETRCYLRRTVILRQPIAYLFTFQPFFISRNTFIILVICLLSFQHFQFIIIFKVIFFVSLDVYHFEITLLGCTTEHIRILIILLKLIVWAHLDTANHEI